MKLPISLILFTALSIVFTLGIILNYTVLPVNARIIMIMADVLFILFVAEQWTAWYKLMILKKVEIAEAHKLMDELDEIEKDFKGSLKGLVGELRDIKLGDQGDRLSDILERIGKGEEEFDTFEQRTKCSNCDDIRCEIRLVEFREAP